MKKAAKCIFLAAFGLSCGRSTRIRTLDPLVPNQVRYQTAPHSDKSYIIDRTAWVSSTKAENLAFRVLRLAKQDVPGGIVRQRLSQVC